LWLRLRSVAFMVMVCSAVIGTLLAVLDLAGVNHTNLWGFVRALFLLGVSAAYWLTTHKAAASINTQGPPTTGVEGVSL
jgi:threonine/homoserine efflux transporter RhtA